MTTNQAVNVWVHLCKVYAGVSDMEEGNSDIHPGIALRIDQMRTQASEQSPSDT